MTVLHARPWTEPRTLQADAAGVATGKPRRAGFRVALGGVRIAVHAYRSGSLAATYLRRIEHRRRRWISD